MNEHVNNPKKERHMPTTKDLVTEGMEAFAEAEAALRKLGRILPKVVKGVIANGDAQAINPLGQIALQLEAKSIPSSLGLQLVTYHQSLVEKCQMLGIDVAAPPSSDDDVIVVFSGGR